MSLGQESKRGGEMLEGEWLRALAANGSDLGTQGSVDVGDMLEDGGLQDDDVSDEEIDVDELEKRMWRDMRKLRRIKEIQRLKAGAEDKPQQKQSQEQARRKKMSRAQDGILKYMLKVGIC